MAVLAFDLGGTRLKAGLVGADGRPFTVVTTATPPVADVPAVLVETGEKLLGGEPADGVGICVPGIVDGGRVLALPGKLEGIVDVDLAGTLREAFGPQAVVLNDALAAGVGEAIAGAGREHARVVVMTIGTGVGVAAVSGGRPMGAGAFGGGILGGQIPIGGGGRDTSGRAGTIEAVCRAARLVELAVAEGGAFDGVEAVYAAHARGDAAAVRGVERYRDDLARAVLALAHAHAPEVIVIGGGPVTGDDPLVPGLAEAVAPRLFDGYRVEVVRAVLGEGAALAGLAHVWRTW